MTTQLEAQFAALPVAVQEQLVQIVRVAAGMAREEKAKALEVLVAVAMTHAQYGDDDAVAVAEMATACALVVRAVDELAGSASLGVY